MNDTIEIEVVHPAEPGALALRTDRDWEKDVEPVEQIDSSEDSVEPGDPREPAAARPSVGFRHRFRIELADAFCYFKVVLRARGVATWSVGDNYLVARGERHRVVFPHFASSDSCSECELKTVTSTLADASLRVRVHLPPGYHENPLRRFPVVYMQDGQNLFFDDEAFLGRAWHVQDAVRTLLAMDLIDPAIVVGVYPDDRMRDYVSPGYDAYADRFVGDLVPWIDGNFRTLAAASHRFVMGSSLGGVASLHLAWRRSDVFGAAACLSSTFGWKDDLLTRVTSGPRSDVRIYLDSGWPGDNYEVTLAMANALARRGLVFGRDVVHFAFPGARHDERAWSDRLHFPLRFLLGRDHGISAIPAVA